MLTVTAIHKLKPPLQARFHTHQVNRLTVGYQKPKLKDLAYSALLLWWTHSTCMKDSWQAVVQGHTTLPVLLMLLRLHCYHGSSCRTFQPQMWLGAMSC